MQATVVRIVFLVSIAAGAARAEPDLRPPANLTAWFSGSYVHVVWDRDLAEAIEGYAVYRSTGVADQWTRLTDRPFPLGAFVDYCPPVGVVRYAVRSVGHDGVESADGRVVEVIVTPTADRSMRTGFTFDKNSIITDQQLLDRSTMPSVEMIQDFLVAHGSVLATRQTVDRYSGNVAKSAARMIFDACQTWAINPQVILTTLQKEKGLITSGITNPENFAMGWNETADSTKDFAAQVYKGTRQFRLYYDRLTNQPGYYDWSVGVARAVTDGTVTPADNATIGLYLYTPYIGEKGGGKKGVGGNYLFWDLWYNSFGFGPTLVSPAAPTTLSPGSLDGSHVEVIETTTPTFAWEAVAGADFYELYISRYPYGEGNVVYTDVWIPGAATADSVPAGILENGTDYRWEMVATNAAGRSQSSARRYFRVTLPAEVALHDAGPEAYSLVQNSPNPFNSVTSIRFTLPVPDHVTITIFNASGQYVATLVSGHFAAGRHRVSWRPEAAPSGVYLCRLEAGRFTETKRLVLVR